MSLHTSESSSSFSDMSVSTPVSAGQLSIEEMARRIEALEQVQTDLHTYLSMHRQAGTSEGEVCAISSEEVRSFLQTYAPEITGETHSLPHGILEKVLRDVQADLHKTRNEWQQLHKTVSIEIERTTAGSPMSVSLQPSSAPPTPPSSPVVQLAYEDPDVADLEQEFANALVEKNKLFRVPEAVKQLVRRSLDRNKIEYAMALIERAPFDVRITSSLYGKIAKHLVDLGEMEELLSVLSHMPASYNKDLYCVECLSEFIRRGNAEAVRSILGMMQESERSLEESVLEFARNNYFDIAKEFAKSIRKIDRRDAVLQSVAKIEGKQVPSKSLTSENLPGILAEIDGWTDVQEREIQLKELIEQLAAKNMMREAIEVVDTKLLMLPPHEPRLFSKFSKVKREFLILQDTIETKGQRVPRTRIGRKIQILGQGQHKRALLVDIYSPSGEQERLVLFKPRRGEGDSKEKSVEDIRRDCVMSRLLHEKGVRHVQPLKEISYLNSKGQVCRTASALQADEGDLAEYLRGHPSLTPILRTRLAVELLQTICDMHRNRIVHGDIKSPNLLISTGKDKQIHIKIADFGSTVAVGSSAPNSYGTFPSPEVFKDFSMDKPLVRTAENDKWNVAGLLCEVLRGQSLFDKHQLSWMGGTGGVTLSMGDFSKHLEAMHKEAEELLGSSSDPCDKCILDLFSLEAERRPEISSVLQTFEDRLSSLEKEQERDQRVAEVLLTLAQSDESAEVVVLGSDFQRLVQRIEEDYLGHVPENTEQYLALPEGMEEATISIGWLRDLIRPEIQEALHENPEIRTYFEEQIVTLHSGVDPVGTMVGVQLGRILRESKPELDHTS